MTQATRVLVRSLLLPAALSLASAAGAQVRLGSLVSPGPLAKAHSSLEGLSNCEKCHERGRRVTPAKCLTCHAPIAQRIQQKKGIHKEAGSGCVTCHVDHAGVDGELRPFDRVNFNHGADTGFALTGLHAPLAAKCDSCHKTRSFLTASPACGSCHTDTHKGSLGSSCEKCHSTGVSFASARTSFDHAATAFALNGAHRTVACASCHKGAGFKVANSSSCATCHTTPHPRAMSTNCTSCHSVETWRTRRFDHSRTAFALVGQHATVDCAACHKAPATRVKPASATCAACHRDPHQGTFKQDCRSCHSERGFAGAAFDHAGDAGFALTSGHAGLTCKSCHKTISAPGQRRATQNLDYRGLQPACATCHDDPHASELGPSCTTCHSTATFRVAAYSHATHPDLFTGRHAPLACDACHKPAGPPVVAAASRAPAARVLPRFTGTPTECASCHQDVHMGQVSRDCASCHSLQAVRFAPDRFTHDQAAFKLTARHAPVACASCHKKETGEFPAGHGAAVRLTGLGTTCASCHADVHFGQLRDRCESCHTAETFKVARYEHQSPPPDFFVGRHLRAACSACHERRTRDFPSGRGTAVEFGVNPRCVTCHTDPHNGSLGDSCGSCHRPEPLRPSHFSPPVVSLMRTSS